MRNSYLLYILIDKCHGILFFTYTYRYFSYDILSTRGIMTLYGLLCHSPIINSVFFRFHDFTTKVDSSNVEGSSDLHTFL